MPVTVQGPDGNSYQFPDGTDKNAAIAYFKKRGIGAKAPPPPSDPPPNSVTGGIGRRVVDTLKGAGQTFFGPPQPGENIITATPAARIVRGAYQSAKKAGGQAVAQAKEAAAIPPGNKLIKTLEYARALNTGLSALDPLASSTVANVNELQDEGRTREAVGQAIPDVALLAAGTKPGTAAIKKVAGVLPKVAEAVTKTGPKVTADLVKEAQAGNAVGDAYSSVQARIETARENALKAGNEKYNAINEKLSHIPADMESVHGLYQDAANAMGETQSMPGLIQRLGKSLQKGEELTYKDEQALYSELGKELSKGTLNGPTYHAFDILHEGIGKDMQRIADSQGMGAELTDARNYWRRMKQTFGKPLKMKDAATGTLRTLAPEAEKQATIANRMRMLGSFDLEIPKQFEQLEKAREAGKGTTPTVPGERRTIGAEDVQSRKLKSLQEEGIPRVRQGGRKLVNYGIGLKTLWDTFGGHWGSLPRDVGFGAAGYGAAEAFARLLERPDIQEMLTKPTARDLAQIPPELRGKFGPMLDAAKAKGIKVDPRLYVAAGAVTPKKGVAAALTAP